MNVSLLAVLNDAERLLIAQTERAELAALDEDAAIELEARIRRARNKFVGQYRRGASAAVLEHGGRGKAAPENTQPRSGGHHPPRLPDPAITGRPEQEWWITQGTSRIKLLIRNKVVIRFNRS
jgi:hypothetical protein